MPNYRIDDLARWLKKLAAERSWKTADEVAETGLHTRRRIMQEQPMLPRALSSASPATDPIRETAVSRVRRAKESGKTVKPRTKLTGPQWQRMVERIVLKSEGTPGSGNYKVKSGGLPEQYGDEARQLMDEAAPATRRIYSRLNMRRHLNSTPGAGPDDYVNVPKDLPYGEALETLARDPKRYSAERYRMPTGNVMSFGDQPGFEKRMYRPVGDVVERAKKAADEVAMELKKEGKTASEESKLRKMAGQVNPSAKGNSAASNIQAVTKQSPEDAHVDLIRQGVALDQIWKYFVKGLKTTTGKYWKAMQGRRGGRVSNIHTRDYFIRQGLRYLENPKSFATKYPDQAQSLKALWGQYEGVGKAAQDLD